MHDILWQTTVHWAIDGETHTWERPILLHSQQLSLFFCLEVGPCEIPLSALYVDMPTDMVIVMVLFMQPYLRDHYRTPNPNAEINRLQESNENECIHTTVPTSMAQARSQKREGNIIKNQKVCWEMIQLFPPNFGAIMCQSNSRVSCTSKSSIDTCYGFI